MIRSAEADDGYSSMTDELTERQDQLEAELSEVGMARATLEAQLAASLDSESRLRAKLHINQSELAEDVYRLAWDGNLADLRALLEATEEPEELVNRVDTLAEADSEAGCCWSCQHANFSRS